MKQKRQIKTLPQKTDRRGFLKKAGVWVGAAAFLEFTALISSYLWSGGQKDEKKDDARYIIAGNAEDFPPGSVTPFRSGFFYLSRLQDGGFLAMSLKCTHLGCSVAWNADKNMFLCPCHHSRFKINGDVLSPPANRALDLYQVVIENGIVKINVDNKLKRKRFKRNQAVYV
jgi:cytochrome b6-f complex iron-sulfur subunit